MIKKMFLCALVAMFGSITACNQQKKESELPKLIKDGAFLLDVRTPGEFHDGSVPGAVNIPLDQLELELNQLEGKTHIIVFCKSGTRAGKAQRILEEHNITNTTNGGSWKNVLKAYEEVEAEIENKGDTINSIN